MVRGNFGSSLVLQTGTRFLLCNAYFIQLSVIVINLKAAFKKEAVSQKVCRLSYDMLLLFGPEGGTEKCNTSSLLFF